MYLRKYLVGRHVGSGIYLSYLILSYLERERERVSLSYLGSG